MLAEKQNKNETMVKMLASVLHDLRETVSISEWEQYIKEHGNDAKSFFGQNTEGFIEYQNFISSHDKGAYLRRQGIFNSSDYN
jgi:hypothetical protein